MPYECFLIEPTGRCRRWLRRAMPGGICRNDGMAACCDARVRIEDGAAVERRDADGRLSYHLAAGEDAVPADDPRWPTACDACARPFGDGAPRQVHWDRAYAIPARHGGGECTLRAAPIGAIWRAEWHEHRWAGADGRCYGVQLPPGGLSDQWYIEQPAASGGGWTRVGVAPDFTCSPSIVTPRYHGWLRGGILSDDLDGRAQ